MSKLCFGYQPDLPPGIGTRGVVPPALRRMPSGPCFSYQADVPHRMSTGTCFSYSPGAPPGTGNGNAAPSAPPGLRSMTYSTCFRY
jgi:hypothetical protein